MIRPALLSDLPQLSRLFDAYRVFYRKESNIAAAEQFLRQRIDANESIIFVDEQENILTGFTQLFPIFSSTRMKRAYLLNDLFVAPSFRGKGISKKLIEAAKQLARENDAAGVLLETEKTNATGNQLYPSTGFEIIDNNFYWWESN